jgi:hypothetical protein
MITHLDEVAAAQAYQHTRAFEPLSDGQMAAILARGRQLYHWFKAHPRIHNSIGITVIASLLAADYFVLAVLPRYFAAPGRPLEGAGLLAASLTAGSAHSFILYSLSVYSLHEAASHHLVFVGRGPLARFGHWVSVNLSRLAAADPDLYSASHMAHHAKFGTAEDAEFLNFVLPRRFFMALLPLAAIVNFSDFIAHRALTYTRGRLISAAVAAIFNLGLATLCYIRYGAPFTLLTMFVFTPHVGFSLDRLRQFTEHNLMPLENRNGARSFGLGFWGLVIGGGPWGQPCHWEHHLVPSLPWYQQLILHRHVRSVLTARQRRQFLIAPIVGFPLLWCHIVTELYLFRRHAAAGPAGGR